MRHLILVLLVPLLGAACAPSEPTRFYTLTSIEPDIPAAETDLVVGVAPVIVANYLDRTGVVTRTGTNELAVAGLHSWIEPLDIQARRVVTRNLGHMLGTDRVFVLPEQRLMPLDYTVEISIERMDVDADETAVLDARWTLFRGDRGPLVTTSPVRITVPVAEPASYETHAAALSDALGQLSRMIATAIAGDSGRRSS